MDATAAEKVEHLALESSEEQPVPVAQLSKDELAAENAQLKKELEAMRKASLGASAGGGNPESGNSPVQMMSKSLQKRFVVSYVWSQ